MPPTTTSWKPRPAKLARVSYRLWVSGEAGRLSARELTGGIPDLGNTAFMLCGPELFTRDLSAQLRAAGVPLANIFSEGFAFR